MRDGTGEPLVANLERDSAAGFEDVDAVQADLIVVAVIVAKRKANCVQSRTCIALLC